MKNKNNIFDIKILVNNLRSGNIDNARVYLYENMNIFMDTKKIHNEDIKHDLFMKLDMWMQSITFDDSKTDKQWMRYMLNEAGRRLIDILRKKHKEDMQVYDLPNLQEEEGEEMEDINLYYDTTLEEIERDFSKEMLHKAILKLPEDEMRVMAMMLDEYGYKQIDIARAWGINFKNISNIYKRAILRLREDLQCLQQ